MALRTTLAALAALLLAAPPATATPPLEAYGALPTVRFLEVSPDGNRLAVLTADAQENQLQVRKSADLTFDALIRLGTDKVIGLQWADADHLILITESTTKVAELSGLHRSRWWMAELLDLKTRKMKGLLDTPDMPQQLYGGGYTLNVLAGWPQPRTIDGKTTIFIPGVSYPEGLPRVTIFKQGFGTGAPRPIEVGTEFTNEMVVDTAGRPVMREDYDEESGNWSLWLRPPGAGWRQVHSEQSKLDAPSLVGFGRTEDTVMVVKPDDTGDRYHEISIANGTWSEPIAALDNTDLIVDRVKRTVLGGVDSSNMKLRTVFLNPADQQLWARIERAFPGELVTLESWNDDRNKIALHVQGPKSGDAFYLLDLTAKRADAIADEYKGISAADIGEVRTISYAAQDGTKIPAFLTIPRGAVAKGLPLVVLVHGGPQAHDEPGFDWWAQALASLGYAVLQPQYRGSDVYDRGFIEAGYGQWGRKMQTDVSDGVADLVRQGIADPAKVCIVGASYGGYAALAGVTLQSGIYRCAVSVAGPSNLRLMLDQTNTDAGPRSFAMRYWKRFMGVTGRGDDNLDAISPAKHADKLSVPLLLIHGEIDTVVDPDQSRAMQFAAQKAGKNVQLVMLKGEDHNLSRSSTRIEMLRAMADFLRANNPPATVADKVAGR